MESMCRSLFILLCACILVGSVVGKKKSIREKAAQSGYAPQASQGTEYEQVGQDDYVVEEKNRNNGFISGRVKPGKVISIGNGAGSTSVVFINSGSDADYYVGYTDGGVGQGYDQPVQPGIHKKPGEDVLLQSHKGNKESGIIVNNEGVQLYAERDSLPNRNVQSGIIVKKRPNGQEEVILLNSNGNKQSQIKVNNGNVQIDSVNDYGDASYNQQNYKPAVKPPNYNYNGRDSIINVAANTRIIYT